MSGLFFCKGDCMLTLEQLEQLNTTPKVSDISLLLLLQLYKNTLCDRVFQYVLREGDKCFTVELVFREENLCHILGIQHIRARRSKVYRGIEGYEAIERGELTFNKLKLINRNGFNSIKQRIKYFVLLRKLLDSPSVIRFNGSLISDCSVVCDIMLYDDASSYRIHLGIENKSDNEYFPKTFIVENDNGDRFTKDQTVLSIESISVIDTSSIQSVTPAIL